MRLAVANSKPTVDAQQILRHFVLSPLSRGVCGAELDGSGAGKAGVIDAASSALGLAGSRDIVIVGDWSYDMLGARSCGLTAVGVDWGCASPGELFAAAADAVAPSPAELLALLVG